MAKTNKPPRLSKTEMASILEQATADFAKALDVEDEAGQRLAKADPGHEAPGEENPEGSSSAPPAPESPEDSAPPADATGTPPAPPAEGTPADGASPPADPAAAAGQGGGEVTVEQIKAEFDQLDVEELKKYFVAAKAALMEKMGGAGGAPEGASPDAGAAPPAAPGPEASASPPPASPSPAASPSPSPEPPFGKGEFDDQSGKVKEGSMHKSDQFDQIMVRLTKAEQAVGQVEELKKALADRDATIASFDEKIAGVAKGVERIVQKTGLRKSVPTAAAAAKIQAKPGEAPAGAARDPKTLTKSEAVAKLNIVTRDPKLAKSDRDLINKFVAGTAPIDTVVKFLG